MRAPRTLALYVSREILVYGGLAFALILAVLVTQNLLRRLEDLIVVGLSRADLLDVLVCLASMLAVYATPVAFLFGVSLALGRLAADGEILAARAGGLGLRELAAGPLALALAICALTFWLMHSVEPAAQRDLRTLLKAVAARGGVLEAGSFRQVMGRVIFVESRDRENRLRGILIEDRSDPRQPFLIFAERGRFVFDEKAEDIRIGLADGDIHLEPDSGPGDDHTRAAAAEEGPAAAGHGAARYGRLSFETLDYRFDVSRLVSGAAATVRPREMTLGELGESIAHLRAGGEKPRHLREADPVEYELQWHRRFALPLAPLLFAGVAVPLGLRRWGTARSWGMLLAAGLVFAYYSLLSFGELLARDGWIGAGAALWAPNACLALASVLLVRRARRPGGV